MKLPRRLPVKYAVFLASAVAFNVKGAGLIENDRQLRDDLAWLAGRHLIALSLSTWPLSESEISRAMAARHDVRDPVSEQVVRRVQTRLAQIKTLIALSGDVATDRDPLPQGTGNAQRAEQSLSTTLNSNGEFWDVTLQGNVEGTQWVSDASHLNPNGSYAAVRVANQWLSFGEIPQWWGPGNDASLIRSDSARPVVGFMLQRDEQRPVDIPWLSGLGRWQYQLFAGQLRQYDHPEQPKLFGGRLTVAPGDAFEVGFSRLMLWGGRGRPQTLTAFRDGVLGRDNTGSQKRDPGDQLGGIDLRIPLGEMPIALYGQVIGDDEAGFLPSHNAWLGGIEGHNAWDGVVINGYLEVADTRSKMKETGIMYYHYCYHGGLYQQGWPLADAMGGDGTQYSARLETVLENDQRLSLRGIIARVNRTSQPFNLAYPKSDTLKGVEGTWTLPVNGGMTLSPGVWFSHRSQGGEDACLRVQFSLHSAP
ncbi:capsule assembly Wzi family protein [Enterobacter bugandensis]|uniref:capsule assembly Wzi family protein n=1 Tax=Enterobacter bugandensis TaxID=881260 RepID=UPI00254D57F4|nr:capsule assembly Wzi family protein [Enterobacter bugandensis]MEC5651416.1 capsule assembly Wzi family protein [Enterobacter bugandensis]